MTDAADEAEARDRIQPEEVGQEVEVKPDAKGAVVVLHIGGNRAGVLEHFEDGLLPVVGRRYAFVCVDAHNGGPDDDDQHSADFRLVRVYP
jgi:hypothetical protein